MTPDRLTIIDVGRVEVFSFVRKSENKMNRVYYFSDFNKVQTVNNRFLLKFLRSAAPLKGEFGDSAFWYSILKFHFAAVKRHTLLDEA